MDDCLLAQYKLTCRQILEFLRTELALDACVVYHTGTEHSSTEFLVGNLPGVAEGAPHTSLDKIVKLVHTGRCNNIVTNIEQSLYPEHEVFLSLDPKAIIAIPLTHNDLSAQSVLCGISFEHSPVKLLNQRSLIEFCAGQIDSAKVNLVQKLENFQTIESLTEQAYQDSMTGLFNRNGWEAAMAVEIASGFSEGLYVSVFVVDVDNLKALNDTQGHAAGDEVIQQVAFVLKERFKPNRVEPHAHNQSFVARTGGDEFIGLLFDCDDEAAQTVSTGISDELLALGVSVSIGFASCRSSRKLPEAVINADEAMYLQKSRNDSDRTNSATNLKLIG